MEKIDNKRKKYRSLMEFAVLGRIDEEIDLKTLIAVRKINICDGVGCDRPGKLVQQFVAYEAKGKPFVFRHYLCQWHLSGFNRTRLKHSKKLAHVAYKSDIDVIKEYKEKRVTHPPIK